MPNITRVSFDLPPFEEEEVLLKAEGINGHIVIFRNCDCKGHIHFDYSVCGLEAEGQFLYDEAEQSKEEAAKELFDKLSMKIRAETMEEVADATKH